MTITPILEQAVKLGASDIHLAAGSSPLFRLNGRVQPCLAFETLSATDVKEMIYGILSAQQKKKFEETFELDGSFTISKISRFRLNVYMHNNGVGAALRIIPPRVPSPAEIGLPDVITELVNTDKGLILITGPTGCGKSTTLASLVDLINQNMEGHILTIEDPIEFIYDQNRCKITQREVGTQTHSFSNAMKSALRQDPDIIMLGEMRDLETISLVLTAAETGHLVLGTLHTTDAPQTIDRIIDVFPSYQKEQIKVQLSITIKAIISQILLVRADGKGMVAAREILISNPAIAELIREGKTHQLYTAIDMGLQSGMISMDHSLANLVKENVITLEEGLSKAASAEQFQQYLYEQA